MDYVPIATQRLIFPAESSPSNPRITFSIQIIPDGLVEGDETVFLIAGSSSSFAIVDPDTATLIIANDDCKARILPVRRY